MCNQRKKSQYILSTHELLMLLLKSEALKYSPRPFVMTAYEGMKIVVRLQSLRLLTVEIVLVEVPQSPVISPPTSLRPQ